MRKTIWDLVLEEPLTLDYPKDPKDSEAVDAFFVAMKKFREEFEDAYCVAEQKIIDGQFRELFEEVTGVLGIKVTFYDYHNLYKWCLECLTHYYIHEEFFSNPYGIEFPLCNKINDLPDGSHTYEYIETGPGKLLLSDISFVYLDEMKKELDAVFDEFAGKIESPDKRLNDILDAVKKLEKMNNNVYIPAWRKHLIDKGFVYDDGKRVKGI